MKKTLFRAYLAILFLGWVFLSMLLIITIVGIYPLWSEVKKDDKSWFAIPHKIIDEFL